MLINNLEFKVRKLGSRYNSEKENGNPRISTPAEV